ncbi:MAG: NAD(P)-binding domain-containing protein, partial [Rhizobiaceae bacterium]
MSPQPMFKRLCLIGIGLIGSSIALRARQDGLAETIVVSTRRQETLDRAKALNLGDVYTDKVSEAVEG